MTTKAPRGNRKQADIYVGLRIRTRRLELGMSQGKLGAALNVTHQQIQKYEKGATRVSGSTLAMIANSLSVPPAYFLDGLPKLDKPQRPNAMVGVQFLATSDGQEIARLWPALKGTGVAKALLKIIRLTAQKRAFAR